MSSTDYNPIPTSWYFDESIYQLEQERIFNQSPNYIGHELMVPNINDYFVLEKEGNSRMLVRNQRGVEVLSNICRHHQAIMLDGTGNSEKIICPLHRWVYNTEGKLMSAPQFPQNPCLNLDCHSLTNWQGLLFQGNGIPVNELPPELMREFDFNGYAFSSISMQSYPFNWKIFMEVFIDNYHIQPFHPGLRSFVNCANQHWKIGTNYSAQFVSMQPNLTKSTSPHYKRYQEALLDYTKGKLPTYGAVWFAYYPNIMIEHYPEMLVISTLVPQGVERCMNIVEFYHPRDVLENFPDLARAAQDAYNETAIEDEEVCARMHNGRRELYKNGLNQAGPFHALMEEGLPSFYAYLHHKLQLKVGTGLSCAI